MAFSIADRSSSPSRRSSGLTVDSEKRSHPHRQSMWHRFGLHRLLGRDDRGGHGRSRSRGCPRSSSPSFNKNNNHNKNTCNTGDSDKWNGFTSENNNDTNNNTNNNPKPHDNLTRRLSRKVGVGLPRAPTFKRQDSERRDRLAPVDQEPRRAVSADRHHTLSTQRSRSPPPTMEHRLSAPEFQWFDQLQTMVEEPLPENEVDVDYQSDRNSSLRSRDRAGDGLDEPLEADTIETELDKKWILNLSMHFRDRSEREKFFVTYAETPNRWRRVTISCDYRHAPLDSLEQDLKGLRYQRDKCARIYESIRESLPEIQFYDTVTNLKLETQDGRLHVHVTEDANEIIPYPPISCVRHLNGALFLFESHLHFEAHLSGFVYRVRLDGKDLIKKEIPGPDTVDEFLYEINALHALANSSNVVKFEGIVVDDRRQIVKGLLISYANQGALVDILYECRGQIEWERRERWAKQIVHGLCEIHEAGYVQGDFTLSNIVVDADDNAKIIDINRRGCPVGWEPPEIAAKIESNQRISMYIGVKTDIYQLGMTLWALAMEEDEPERQEQPLVLHEDTKVPQYYRELVAICLSSDPRRRLSAKELLVLFPQRLSYETRLPSMRDPDTGNGVMARNGIAAPRELSYNTTPPDLLSPPGRTSEDRGYYSPTPDSLYDGYSSSQYGTSRDSVPPYSVVGGHRSRFANGTRGRTSDTLEDVGVSETQLKHSPLPQAEIVLPREYGSVDDHAGHLGLSSTEPLQYSKADNVCQHSIADSVYPGFTTDQTENLQSSNVRTLPERHSGASANPTYPSFIQRHAIDKPLTEEAFAKNREFLLSTEMAQLTNPSSEFVTDSTHANTSVPGVYDTDADSGRSIRGPSAPVSSSLLHSTLPINPAVELLRRKSKRSDLHKSRLSSPWSAELDHSIHYDKNDSMQTSCLADSRLPINPAVIATTPYT